MPEENNVQTSENLRKLVVGSDFVLKHFPKPCRPRKQHNCMVCEERIQVLEPCCRWAGLDPGEGYRTCHAHPECYDLTQKWDGADWECNFSGDTDRPKVRMHWP